jgi:hypothetical protein
VCEYGCGLGTLNLLSEYNKLNESNEHNEPTTKTKIKEANDHIKDNKAEPD